MSFEAFVGIGVGGGSRYAGTGKDSRGDNDALCGPCSMNTGAPEAEIDWETGAIELEPEHRHGAASHLGQFCMVSSWRSGIAI